MSMNLNFCTKSNPPAFIDFPFQTPTVLTYAVMAEKDNTKRLKLIREHMVTSGWKKKDMNIMMGQIKSLMNNDGLELSYM